MAEKGTLTARQHKAIELLLTPASMADVALGAAISLRQLHRWKNDAAFIVALQSAQSESSRRAISIAAGALIDATKSAVYLAQHGEDEPTRLRAALTIVDIYERLHERDELTGRIERLEALR